VKTSNVYVLQGDVEGGKRIVWVFGAGYGDPGGDVLFYRVHYDAMRGSGADASEVASVIETRFGLQPAGVALRFITPHAHLDHLNAEFFRELEERGYPLDRGYIHTRDRLDFETCDEPCCDAAHCTAEHPLAGVPYDPVLSADLMSRFTELVNDDACSADFVDTFTTPTFAFTTPSGTWKVRKVGGSHTPGSVNLDRFDDEGALTLRIFGSMDRSCTPPGVTTYDAHGRL
jgi:hypothetical protein